MMEERDFVLLAHLRRNARSKLTHISREMDMPVSTIFERLNGVISNCVQKYTCVLKNSEIGLHSRATVILKVDKEQKSEIGLFLEKHPNVNSLYKINNGYDFLADIIFKQMADLEGFLEHLERSFKIKTKDVYFIIDEIKQEGLLSDPRTAAMMLKGMQK